MKKQERKPFSPKGRRHPSGRPIRKSQRGIVSRPRFIDSEPLTPGLRKEEGAEAIGFLVDYLPGDEPDDDEDFDYTRESE
jgi:hypothetical protein